MKDLFKSSFLIALIFLLLGCSEWSKVVGMTCKEKFSKKNQEITDVKLDKDDIYPPFNRTLKGTVSLNNEPEKTCISNFYKIEVYNPRSNIFDNPLPTYEDKHQTICGEHIFRGWAASWTSEKTYHPSYMNFRQRTVVDKNENEFPLELVNREIKITCQDNYSPGLVRQLSSTKEKYKVRANPTHGKPIYLKNTFYVVRKEEESFYRLPIKPNF
tara:strand:- start:236 stop:877 length:642 start_codon:yes stop_codon:yes gene_type:complete